MANRAPQQRRRMNLCTSLCLLLMTWSWSASICASAESLDAIRVNAASVGHATRAASADLVGQESHSDAPATYQLLTEDETPIPLERRQTIEPSPMVNNVPANNRLDPSQSNIFVLDNVFLQATHAPAARGLPESIPEAYSPVQRIPVPAGNVGKAEDGDVSKRSPLDENPLHDDSGQALGRRQGPGNPIQIFISVNTCSQPQWTASRTQTDPPSQLTLYVSTEISTPGPHAPPTQQQIIPLLQGFANFTANVTSPVYIAIASPSLDDGFTGHYQYEVASSIDGFYHAANSFPFFYLIDTDNDSALLVTDNLTQADNGSTAYEQWMSLPPPFVMFAQSSEQSNVLSGMQNSYCAFSRNPTQIKAGQNDPDGRLSNVKMSMITRGLGNKPKQQFFVSGLNGSTTYSAWLAFAGNSSASGSGVVGGGGTIWSTDNDGTGVSLTTKRGGNCQLMYDLDFCSEVAYAVPSNPNTFPTPAGLASHYDGYAAQLYTNFSRSLQLVACNTTASAQYSLAKNCTDCARAYKEWLCAVTMPRCEDFDLDATASAPRNMGQQFFQNNSYLPPNVLQQPFLVMSDAPVDSVAQRQTYASSFASNQSRNPIITADIRPGPYNELLPCEDLCFSLVQSCPAQLGFNCPLPGRGLERGYGKRSGGGLTCSYLGAYYFINAAERQGVSQCALILGLGLALVWAVW